MKKPLWKATWLPGLLITLFFMVTAGTKLMTGLDRLAYDTAVRLASARSADDNVVLVTIDDKSVDALGPLPWARDRYAQLVNQLARDKAAVIGFAMPFDTQQNEYGLQYIQHLQQDSHDNDARLQATLQRAAAALDTDGTFGSAIKEAGDVVLGMPYRFPLQKRIHLQPLDPSVEAFAMKNVAANQAPWFGYVPSVLTARAPDADRLFAPVPALAQGAAGIGMLNAYPLGGGSMRAVPLVLRYGDRYFPSFALQVAVQSLKLKDRNLNVLPGRGVVLDGTTYATDPALQAYPRYYTGRDGKSPFKTYSFADVYARRVAASQFNNKIVLIGVTVPSLVDKVSTPIGVPMAPVVATAHVVSSLLNNDMFSVPSWAIWVQLAALLGVGLYLMFVLPRFRLTTGLILSLLLLIVIVNVHFILMTSQSIWLPLMVPTAALLAGVAVLSLRRLAHDRAALISNELFEANRTLGQMYQSQGQLDMAFEKYRHCPISDALQEQLYNLGLDYERKRQFNKAVGVFNHILEQVESFRDARERIRLNQEMEKMYVLGKGIGGGGGGGSGTMVMSHDKLQKPMLGRYQIEKELGRGAMGMVYLGRDPRIARTVAIKTMALSQEFDEEQVADVRDRFFREAETAGRLNHPNIVTVYDVGEEQELAYIAMDYAQGKPLSAYCKFESLLPAAKVFDIMIKVAEALDYAHQQQVVHRDIKPANIMYDDKSGAVKVTDFGVACLIDSSKTKTGTVLGSPSYMSPEQLAGKKVDGRSDLFSLGVTMFQLLTGELPFVADSLASLMYKIANEKHVDVRVLRPDLPPCVSTIINRALYKEVDKRVQSGHHLANALRRCKPQLTKDN